jgi:tRNA threonylcarbamoyladenosine biosynthesis protein TsaB
MLLAIDTATNTSTLALHDGAALLCEEAWRSPANNHAVELAPAVQRMMARCGVAMGDLTALAVCSGPGSYTGLRIGVSLAKGIASARNLPLVGVGSLDIQALGHPQATGGLVSVIQAGRGRIIAGAYGWRKGRWKARNEALLMTWETLIATIDGPATVTGEIDREGLAALTQAQSDGVPVTIAAAAHRLRRAGYMADEAWQQLRGHEGDFPAQKLAPIYVKTKDLP